MSQQTVDYIVNVTPEDIELKPPLIKVFAANILKLIILIGSILLALNIIDYGINKGSDVRSLLCRHFIC